MAARGQAQRLTRLERQLRCPHHQSWLYCGCDDLFDVDRLSDAEGDRLLQLAAKAGALDDPADYGVCARCGMARQCLECNGEYLTRTGGLERLTPDERARAMTC